MPLVNWLAIIGVAIWAGFEVVLRQRGDQNTATWQGGAADRGSTRLLLAAYAISAAVISVLAGLGLGRLPIGPRWIGVTMIVAGLALRGWAMRVLGRDYTRTVRVTTDQHVVTTGPYRRIRHPGYAGSLLVWTGYALSIGNWIALLIVTAILLAAYSWRITAEEATLTDTLGQPYRDYQKHTQRLVPFIY
jgi:protein-S-isoprenylcysteine O-methyltransferase